MGTTYLLVASLCLLGLMIRTSYELLKKAGRLGTKNKAIFALVFVAMSMMLASWPVMCPLDPWRIACPGVVAWTGLGGVAAALVLVIAGLVQLRGLENIDHLVTTGCFARIRHPMYTGFVLWIVGWAVRYGAVTSMGVGLLCIANILYWRHLEERWLESRYGESYRVYRKATWL